ncbi:MAG: class I SAM-dependent methyltransferase [Bacteroidia bacterium]
MSIVKLFYQVKKRIKIYIYNSKYKRSIAADDLEARFTNIYKNNIWFRNQESKSGAGSTLEATNNIREWLPKFISENKIENLIDLGCGDFNWMKEVKLDANYFGFDIVEHVIKENTNLYENRDRRFGVLDGVNEPLPNLPRSAILCREVLFHLSFEDGKKLLKNCLDSSPRYLLLTSNPTIKVNKDIRSGEFRRVNLEVEPYNLGKPINLIVDSNTVSENRQLCVWKVNQIGGV